ncbi:MAG TPA: CHASE3 domain-containing protein [Propionibacteriaceae bacterium]|nr:CHASE3 domain-containing protein [Propionibacteriaceae bacterium]
MKGGLARRTLIRGVLLVLVGAAAFGVVLSSVADLHQSERQARRSQEVLVVANHLERLVVDLETGLRGYLITGQPVFLQPAETAQASFSQQAAALQQFVADNPAQLARAQRIVQATRSYIDDYFVPVRAAAQRNPASARTEVVMAEGERRIDAIRGDFDQFIGSELGVATAQQQRADALLNRAVIGGVGGLALAILLIAGFVVAEYLTIVRPLRAAATMAQRLAAGDLDVRIPDQGVGEIGVLERSFNHMASSLQESRNELLASRQRIVAAADHSRRRIERDLHDGIQQRMVSILLELRTAEAGVPAESSGLRSQLAAIADDLTGSLDDLRELSRGIHPAILSEGGLGPALKALGRRSPVPVEVRVELPERLPESVEVGAYFVVSEALANAAKHAQASVVQVDVRVVEDALRLSVNDDGVGDADPSRGSGLLGLADRVQALGGAISITSPSGLGTTLNVTVPITGS